MANKNIEMTVFSSFEELKKIEKEWDNFLENSGCEIFLSYEWCRIWWNFYGNKRKLKVIVFTHENNTIGLLPLFIDKLWNGFKYVKVLKLISSDFTLAQFHLPIKNEYLSEVFELLRNFLEHEKNPILYLGPIAGKYKNMDKINAAFETIFSDTYSMKIFKSNVETYFNMKKSLDEYLNSINNKEKADINRNYRYLQKLDSKFINTSVETIIVGPECFEKDFDEFVKMHNKHWQFLGMPGHFSDWPDSIQFHKKICYELLKKDRLMFLKIIYNGDCLGYEYIFKFNNRYYEFLNSRTDNSYYKNISTGKINFSEMIKYALTDKIDYIDSMRGKYEHKIKLGGELHDMHEIFIIKKSFLLKLNYSILKLFAKFYTILFYKIWYLRLGKKFKINNRKLSKFWIRYSFLGLFD